MDCAERQVLGEDVHIQVEVHDETNTVIPIDRIIRRIRRGIGGMVGFVGVQTNQFPRSLDVGKAFLQAQGDLPPWGVLYAGWDVGIRSFRFDPGSCQKINADHLK